MATRDAKLLGTRNLWFVSVHSSIKRCYNSQGNCHKSSGVNQTESTSGLLLVSVDTVTTIGKDGSNCSGCERQLAALGFCLEIRNSSGNEKQYLILDQVC